MFTGLGCVEGEYNINLRDGAKPTIQPQRNVPLRLLDKLKSTICDLEKAGSLSGSISLLNGLAI